MHMLRQAFDLFPWHLTRWHTDVKSLGIIDAHLLERIENSLIFDELSHGENADILTQPGKIMH